jgi:hypothetical protein
MMIPWWAIRDDPPRVTFESGLAPVAFDPDVATTSVGPVTIDPAGVGMGRTLINSRDPDIMGAVPAVIAGVPGPVAMLRRGRRNTFNRSRWWWSDTNNNLCLSNACGE